MLVFDDSVQFRPALVRMLLKKSRDMEVFSSSQLGNIIPLISTSACEHWGRGTPSLCHGSYEIFSKPSASIRSDLRNNRAKQQTSGRADLRKFPPKEILFIITPAGKMFGNGQVYSHGSRLVRGQIRPGPGWPVTHDFSCTGLVAKPVSVGENLWMIVASQDGLQLAHLRGIRNRKGF